MNSNSYPYRIVIPNLSEQVGAYSQEMALALLELCLETESEYSVLTTNPTGEQS